jgi:hypothetical protein
MVLSLLFTPLGRYAAITVVALMLIAYGIHAIKEGAVAEIKAEATADVLRRTQDAIRAGDAVDVTPDGLLKSDGHKRD